MAHSFALTVACRGADRYHPRTMTWSKLSLFAAVSLSIFPFIAVSAAFAQAVPSKEVDRAFPDAHDLYLDLHQNPSSQATKRRPRPSWRQSYAASAST